MYSEAMKLKVKCKKNSAPVLFNITRPTTKMHSEIERSNCVHITDGEDSSVSLF